jgi:hypothetical protein
MSDRTPCSWHSACAGAGEAGSGEEEEEEEGAGGLRAADREALAERERCVKAMDASGPASVRMCL